MNSIHTFTNILFALSVLFFAQIFATAEAQCIYIDGSGMLQQVNTAGDVPSQFRNTARCAKSGGSVNSQSSSRDFLAAPNEIQIEGNSRSEYINTALGRVQLRWPRRIESVFGRTPLRATTDAANTVSRALKRSAFPSKLQSLNLDWQVVFMDADLPETQIPTYLIQNCHPGWMTPPANIYIVAQRVAGVCSPGERPSRVADEMLTRVMVHEMGHAVEYYMLDGHGGGDRMRAEGFATWFEQYASGFSSILNQRNIISEAKLRARNAIAASPTQFSFSGSGTDYARAAAFFSAIESRLGARAIADVYGTMVKDDLSFFPAIERSMGWNANRLNEEVLRYLK